MSMKRLFKWQLFIAVFIIGLIVGSTLSLFFYMKNVDVFEIRKRQEYLIKEVEELKKERQRFMYILKEKGLIKEWNEQAVIEPEEEGK